MIARRTLTALASTALAGLGVAGLATSAQADTTVTFSGGLTNISNEWIGGSFTPSQVVGPTVTIHVTATGLLNNDIWVQADGALTKTDGTVCEDFGVCEVVAGGAAVTFNVVASATNASISLYEVEGWPISGTFSVTYAAQRSGATGAAPAPLIQQIGVPESGTCDEAASDNLNWSGVASGGWGESWAQWINDGDGGFVCTRTLVYNTSQAAWEVE
ncbi:MAG TPA: hypothetical protein VIG24_06360 [Acidimicrobiia bacterium]